MCSHNVTRVRNFSSQLLFLVYHLQDLVSHMQTTLLSRTSLLNARDEDAHVVSSRQPQTNAVSLLEVHHHSIWPAGGDKHAGYINIGNVSKNILNTGK